MWDAVGQKKRRIRALVTVTVLLMSSGFKRVEVVVSEEECEGLSTLGSRPPNCEHKCGGCIPCGAIQVPTPTNHVGVQYANYEPEGWKCKCGDSFFNP
ncbi:hypothetical protein BVC80_1717g10 [Macleaya cordata]|uniref:Epidermal patterning factor-like protein n=1 Tax=Macleaya cordata TaxID=56857 RepID=A0A200Q1V4_MACCD|nr:hypothetical protein BVC80_1717g10 [Macleaya cordata]